MRQYDIDALQRDLKLIEEHLERESKHLLPSAIPDADTDHYYPCWTGALKGVLQIVQLDLQIALQHVRGEVQTDYITR